MRGIKFDVSAGALLLFALAYFFDGSGALSALLPAAVHEMGHIAVLTLSGARLRRLSLNFFGLKLDYSGSLPKMALLLSALAGPAAGMLYALTALAAGTEYLKMSGSISFLLSVFNMLPALPLDGGRTLAVLAGPRAARRASLVTALAMMVCGVWALFSHGSLSLLVMGGWLLAVNAA